MTTFPSNDTLYAAVRAVYANYRKELMNRKYYGCRLAATKRLSTILDITVAVGTSTAVGAWALWHSPGGQAAWAVLSGAAALFAIAKPTLRLPSETERYTRHFAGHSVAFYDLQALVDEISRLRDYPTGIHGRYLAIVERANKLSTDDDPSPKQRLLKRTYREVTQEIPATSLWWPERGGTNDR